MLKRNKQKLLCSLLSGACLVLIFPKAGQGVLAWAALIPLLMMIKETGPLMAFRWGWLCGAVYFLGTLYWIPYTLSKYGKLPLVLSWFVLFVMVAFLALYVGLFAWGTAFCRDPPCLPFPLLAAVWWVGLEYLRNFVLSGFPWVLLGYSQAPYLPMVQIAEFGGVYLVSGVIVFVNAAGAESLDQYRGGKRVSRGWAAAAVLLLTGCYGYGIYQLSGPVPERDLEVAVLQGNIPQEQKWDPAFQEAVFNTYRELTLEASRAGEPRLIVWPEASTPFYFQSDGVYRPRLLQLARESGAHLLFGSPGYMAINREVRPFNGAYLVSPRGEELGHYYKIHLVPFGEYVPLERLFSFTGKLVAQAGNFISGWEYSLLPFPEAPVGTIICYEVIFPDLVRRFVKEGAALLVNITNDAWFGESAAPYQHFAMLTLRAVENRRYLIRSANTGISGFFDPWGRVLKRGGIFKKEFLAQRVGARRELTFYSAYGDVWARLCLGLALYSVIFNLYRRKKGSILCKRS